jgi:GT2 family glycosyltransferase
MHSLIPKVGIVVLNWNRWRDTIDCIESVRQLDYRNYCLYVVDNASADGSEQKLRDWDAGLRIIQSGANLGWAGGCNVGIRAALADGCDHVYMLNNDATVRADTLTRLVEAAEHPDSAALGSLVLSAANPDEAEFAGCVVDPRTGHPQRIHGPLGEVARNELAVPTIAVKGCSMLMTRPALEKVGLFAEEYFLNYDETDWCYRAVKLGMINYYVPTSIILHKGAVSFQGVENPLYLYFMTRNRLLFARRHLGRRGGYFAWRSTLWEFRQALFRSPVGRSSAMHRALLLYSIWLAVWDYCLGRFGNCPEVVRRMWRRYLA